MISIQKVQRTGTQGKPLTEPLSDTTIFSYSM